MTNFQDLKDKPDAFLSLTGHTLEDTELLPHFSCCFLEYMHIPLMANHVKIGDINPIKKHEDMLLFILIYLRDAPKQVLLGALFGMPQPLANKWIHLLLPILSISKT